MVDPTAVAEEVLIADPPAGAADAAEEEQCSEQEDEEEEDGDTEELPDHLICPIGHDLFVDPVLLDTGVTYDRASITYYLSQTSKPRCPVTNYRLPSVVRLVPNLAVRTMVLEWLERAGRHDRADEMRLVCRRGAAAAPIDCSGGGRVMLRSVDARVRSELLLRNELPVAIERVWFNYDGNRVSYGMIAPGKTSLQPTFQTHPWLLLAAGRHIGTYIAQAGRQELHIGSTPGHPILTVSKPPAALPLPASPT